MTKHDESPKGDAPSDTSSWADLTNRGNGKQETGDLPAAITDFSAAIALAPDELAPRYNRANAHGLAGDIEASIVDYTEALRIDPGFVPALIRRGLARQQSDDLEGAAADLNRAVSLDPESPDAHGTRGSLRALLGDYAGARQDCERALSLAPEDWKQRTDVTELLDHLTAAAAAEGEREDDGEATETDEGDEDDEPNGAAIATVEAVLKAAGWSHDRVPEETDEDEWASYATSIDQGPLGSALVRVSEPIRRFLLHIVYQPAAPEEHRAQVAELITRANDGLCDGNFEMSYRTGEVRYKVAIDWSGTLLDPMLIRNAILNAMDMAEAYGDALSAVLTGKLTALQAIEAAEADL
ncbi:tetratricopeptide repeat protein [Chondromyces crocatus]|uniref:Uncharacterized protein n=1 Tax=Chondromyces crocatus TaxID=52 RepID=A0A0K1EPD7_CHOCO|nr:tetratricopeptide repeat protein [Chondromyces crocatus]AKT42780.1 uncharacterized protein CMC5_070070 [Chondromyces crocatus]